MSTIQENSLDSRSPTAVEKHKIWLSFKCNGPRVADTSILCLRQITQKKKKQLQRAPKTVESVDTCFLCLDCSKVVKLLNKLVET